MKTALQIDITFEQILSMVKLLPKQQNSVDKRIGKRSN